MGRYCGLSEYEIGIPDRFHIDELQVDESYMLMAALKPNIYQVEAVQCLSRMNKIDKQKSGLAVVQFALVDDQMNPVESYSGRFSDGFWLDAARKFTIRDIRTREAYFKFDDSGFDDGIARLGAGLRIPVNASR